MRERPSDEWIGSLTLHLTDSLTHSLHYDDHNQVQMGHSCALSHFHLIFSVCVLLISLGMQRHVHHRTISSDNAGSERGSIAEGQLPGTGQMGAGSGGGGGAAPTGATPAAGRCNHPHHHHHHHHHHHFGSLSGGVGSPGHQPSAGVGMPRFSLSGAQLVHSHHQPANESTQIYRVGNKHRERAILVDRISRWTFPLSFIFLNCIYWYVYLDWAEMATYTNPST